LSFNAQWRLNMTENLTKIQKNLECCTTYASQASSLNARLAQSVDLLFRKLIFDQVRRCQSGQVGAMGRSVKIEGRVLAGKKDGVGNRR